MAAALEVGTIQVSEAARFHDDPIARGDINGMDSRGPYFVRFPAVAPTAVLIFTDDGEPDIHNGHLQLRQRGLNRRRQQYAASRKLVSRLHVAHKEHPAGGTHKVATIVDSGTTSEPLTCAAAAVFTTARMPGRKSRTSGPQAVIRAVRINTSWRIT